MKRHTILLLLTASMMAAQAQEPNSTNVLYHSGQLAKDQGLLLKNWGSGTISQTDETSFEGAYSLQISTRNFFQGGILSYQTALDLSGKFENKDNLLQITFKTADQTSRNFGGPRGPSGAGGSPGAGRFPGRGAGTPGGGPGGASGFPGAGGFPGQGPGAGGGGQGGQRFPGGPGQRGGFSQGQPGAPGAATTTPAVMKNLRIIVTTTDGKKSEAYIPIDTSTSSERGWKSVAIPLQAISGFDRTNKIVNQLGFSGDGTSTFFVGDLRLVNDSTPIRGEIENQSTNFAAGDTVVFHATGSGGSSVLKYSWDFGAGNGIATDAVGQTVTRKFRKPGKYRITLTISDFYGLKPAYTSTLDVTVND